MTNSTGIKVILNVRFTLYLLFFVSTRNSHYACFLLFYHFQVRLREDDDEKVRHIEDLAKRALMDSTGNGTGGTGRVGSTRKVTEISGIVSQGEK